MSDTPVESTGFLTPQSQQPQGVTPNLPKTVADRELRSEDISLTRVDPDPGTRNHITRGTRAQEVSRNDH